MTINALLMDPKDNVVTCVAEVPAGQQVVYRRGEEFCSLTAEETIPYCHKIALESLAAGQEVYKYGEIIGVTTMPIARGHRVYHENIVSVPRDYDSEMI